MVLRVIVTAEGLPRQVAVKQSCGVAALDAAALTAVKGWSFDPGRRQGRAVETEIEVPVRFRLAP